MTNRPTLLSNLDFVCTYFFMLLPQVRKVETCIYFIQPFIYVHCVIFVDVKCIFSVSYYQVIQYCTVLCGTVDPTCL